LVYSYLNREDYTEVAEEFAKICRIDKSVKPLESLETVVQSEENEITLYSKSVKVRTCRRQNLIAKSVDCQTSVQDVANKYKSFERKSENQTIDEYTHQLVYSYLNREDYTEVAEELAKIYRVQKSVTLADNLETIFQLEKSYKERATKVKSYGLTGRRGMIAGVDFVDTDEVKFSNFNSKGGAIILTYKGKQYTFLKILKNGVLFWRCRRHSKLKCHGFIHFCKNSSMVLKENPHNEKDHSEQFSIGTGETAVTYSKSRQKEPVLHYQGYEYLRHKGKGSVSVDGRVNWRCRQINQMKCKGNLWMRNGQVDGQVREHSHLPPDQAPVDKPKSDRMLSSLFK